MSRNLGRVGLVWVVLSLVSGTAQAGGMWLPGRGVGPLGRGGAVVASIDDPNALWYNPAALVLGDGHQLLVDVAMIDLSAEFTRADGTARNGDPIDYPTVSNQAAPQWVPQLLFSTDFGRDDLALGVGVYAPYAPRYRFPEDGPQRYAIIDNTSSLILYQHLAVAYRPIPQVAIGAGLQNMTAAVDSTAMSSSYVGLWGEPEDFELDIMTHLHGSDPVTITGNFGVWGEPMPGLQLGASAQLPATVHDPKAKLETRLPSHYSFDGAQVEGDTMDLSLELPWILRFGVRYGIEALFDVEVDVTYETWSVHEQIKASPDNIRVTGVPTVGEVEVGALTLERNFKDTLGVHIGGDWHLVPETLTLRTGFMYEQGAIPDETYSVFQVDSDKFAPTLGLTARFSGWRIDAAYSYILQASRDISNSEVPQINPSYDEGATIVGNGEYSSSYNVFGVGVGYTF